MLETPFNVGRFTAFGLLHKNTIQMRNSEISSTATYTIDGNEIQAISEIH